MSKHPGRVAVIGGLNVDLVVRVPNLPVPGETVLGADLVRHPGGKGANQAVAARRAGATVQLIGAIGDDADGRWLLEGLQVEGIDISAVTVVREPTGMALISTDPSGENQISVAPGANAVVRPAAWRADVEVLLASLEVPMPTVVAAATAAHVSGATVVINPAPWAPLPPELLELEPILVPNEHELAAMRAGATVDQAVDGLRSGGAVRLVVTLGSRGCVVVDGAERHDLPAAQIGDVVDATGAGDTFCGVLAAWLSGGALLLDAATAANLAAGLSTRAHGAQAGMPRRDEIISILSTSPS